MAYLFPNPPSLFFCRYTNQKMVAYGVFYLPIWRWWKWAGDRIGLCFLFCSPFGPLSVISSRSRSEMTIYLKEVPEADSYICLNYVLAICCSFYGLISVRFGGLFILFSISSGQVQGFCFFLPFPFTFPNTPYCLLPPLHIWVYPLLRCWFFFLRLFSSIVSFELTIPYFIS